MKFNDLFSSLITLCLLTCCTNKELPIPYPSVPTGLKEVSRSKSKVTLSWDKSANTSSYKLYRDDIWIFQGDSLTFTDSNLKFKVKYKYNVSALNSAWESPKSSPIFIEIIDSSLIKPNVPKSLRMIDVSSSSVKLAWDKVDNVNKYNIYRDNKKINETTFLEYKDAKLTSGTIYQYYITAVNNAGESLSSLPLIIKTNDSIPHPPKTLTVIDITYSSVKLAWDKVDNANKYNIYRDNKKINETTFLEYKDEKLTSGTIYQYYITAVNSTGESLNSLPLIIKTKDTVPLPPKTLTVLDIKSTSVKLTWEKVESTIFYNIYRNGIKLKETSVYEIIDDNLTPNTTYEYNVTANNLSGESSKSPSLLVKTNPEEASLSSHLKLGNPTNATTNLIDNENFLIIKKQYALSYNNKKHIANWVSWELSKSWLGTSPRQDDFRPDNSLPSNWYKSIYSDYTNTGFDRGHLCPSADRTSSIEDNSSTFLMTNIIPQAPKLNRESWAFLEDYCRMIVGKGYKAFIISGTIGIGGTGSSGFNNYVKNMVTVPKQLYKIAVFVKEGSEISTTSNVIAIRVPNSDIETDNINWLNFVTSVSDIESNSDCVFFSTLPQEIQVILKKQIFDISKNPFTIDPPVSTYKGNIVFETPKHENYYYSTEKHKVFIK